ncbi:flagellar filament capping protein FliD [Veronia pacifica]|uniref:Flagellar hook-associated protein 2 n=1 Tax=Veronia pacifica TaxID=1080227 RepID=A0A1C3E7I4_9GAMM|nr:flagellar filament capping protein FliD [Veronia pacifica]ODA29196.1 flagellar hook protein [Veronia pacifica]
MGLSASGLVSGLDINNLVTQLVEAERAPKQGRITKQLNDIETDISAYGRLKDALDKMKDVMSKFRDDHTFAARSSASDDSEAVSVSAEPDAMTGSYSVDVQQLAQSQKLVSSAFTEGMDFGAGSMTLQLGSESLSITIGDTENSLSDIANLINKHESNPGIAAAVIKDDDGERLILGSEKTGASNTISLSVDSSVSGELNNLAYVPGSVSNLNEVQQAKDARIVVDGLATITSSNNTFSDAIPGVKIEAKELSAGSPVNISVSEDKAAVKKVMEEFVDSYNAFFQITQSVAKYDPESQTGGALVGDSLIRSMTGQLRTVFSSPIEGAPESMKTLSEFGVTTTREGRLEIDGDIMDKHLDQNFSKLGEFFDGNNGFAKALEKTIDRFTSYTGSIKNRENSLNDQKDRIQDDQAALDMRMQALEERTRRQFSAMESAMGQMQYQMSAMMSMMPAMGNQ